MIRIDRPPNYDQIVAAFPGARKAGVVFAYGEDIYNPSGVLLGAELMAHEYRHCARQWQITPEKWWDQYLTNPEFRYGEELLAHVEEYIVLAKTTKDKNQRAKLLQRTAGRLVAPLYNYQPPRSTTQAVRDLYQLAHG